MQCAADPTLAMDILKVEILVMRHEPRPKKGPDHHNIFRARRAADLLYIEIKPRPIPAKPDRKLNRYPVTVRRKRAQSDPQHQINPLMPAAVVPVASTLATRTG